MLSDKKRQKYFDLFTSAPAVQPRFSMGDVVVSKKVGRVESFKGRIVGVFKSGTKRTLYFYHVADMKTGAVWHRDDGDLLPLRFR